MKTKIDFSHNIVKRLESIDDIAPILFPGNKRHQKIFVAIFVELKWSNEGFLPSLNYLPDKYGFSFRVLETVRAKMRRLGLIDHVSRFNKRYGYREGYVLSSRFTSSLKYLADLSVRLREKKSPQMEKRERESYNFF
jgi:hypothetical protein